MELWRRWPAQHPVTTATAALLWVVTLAVWASGAAALCLGASATPAAAAAAAALSYARAFLLGALNHLSALHLGLNTLFLCGVGGALEEALGAARAACLVAAAWLGSAAALAAATAAGAVPRSHCVNGFSGALFCLFTVQCCCRCATARGADAGLQLLPCLVYSSAPGGGCAGLAVPWWAAPPAVVLLTQLATLNTASLAGHACGVLAGYAAYAALRAPLRLWEAGGAEQEEEGEGGAGRPGEDDAVAVRVGTAPSRPSKTAPEPFAGQGRRLGGGE